MPTFEITDPDTGDTIEMTGNAAPTGDQIRNAFAAARESGALRPQRSTAQQAGRQVGLAGRAAIEGTTQLPALFANALAAGANIALDASGVEFRFPDQSEGPRRLADLLGLPTPETGTERIVGRAAEAVAAVSPSVATGKLLAKGAEGAASRVGTVLAETPGIQAGAGIAGEGAAASSAELGASPGQQAAVGIPAAILAPASSAASSRAARAVTGAVRGVREATTEQGRRQVVGGLLQDRARNAGQAARNLDQSGEALTEQTTGAVSKDSGLLVLERVMRNKDTNGRFAAQASDANLRRQKILDVLGGDKSIPELEAGRAAATSRLREDALNAADGFQVNMAPVQRSIDALQAGASGARKEVRRALAHYAKQFEGETDARRLYEIRKDLRLDIEGKSRNPKRTDFKQAAAELRKVRGVLDQQLEKVAPGFREYLDTYARLSREIDQKGIIKNIQERATFAVPDPATGRGMLSQAKFTRMVTKERDAGLLTDEHLGVLDAIATDLDAGQAINAQGIRPSGSDTVQNLTVAHVIGRGIGGNTDSALMNALVKPIKWVTELTEDQIQGLLVDAMLDPKLASRLLSEATPRNIDGTSRALKSFSDILGASSVGATAPADS